MDGIRDHERFLRVWVKRPEGWRLFNYLETPMKPKTGLRKGGGPCDNPCKTLPYTPTTEMDKAILEAWQKAKNDEWHPNASDWALRVGDEFVIINDHTSRTKAERVALLTKQQAAGEAGPPGDPIHTRWKASSRRYRRQSSLSRAFEICEALTDGEASFAR